MACVLRAEVCWQIKNRAQISDGRLQHKHMLIVKSLLFCSCCVQTIMPSL